MQWIHTVIVAHTMSFGLALVLLISVLRKTSRDGVRVIFAGLLLSCMTWLVTNGISETLTFYKQPADWIGEIGGVAVQLSALCVFLLCEYLPPQAQGRFPGIRIAIASIITLALCPLVLSDDWMSNRRVLNGVNTADYGLYYQILGLWAILLVALGLIILYRKYQKSLDQRERMHIGFFWIGIAGSSLLVFFFSYLLPLFGSHRLFFLGVDSFIVLVALAAYAIIFHRLLDLRTTALRFSLRIILSLIISFLIYFVFLVLILNRNISDFSWDLAISLWLFFIAAVLFARILLPSLDRKLFYRLPRAENLFIEFFKRLNENEPTGETLREIFSTLQNAFPFTRGMIIAGDGAGVFHVYQENCKITMNRETGALFRRLLKITRLPANFFEAYNQTFIIENRSPFAPMKRSGPPVKGYNRIIGAMNYSLDVLSREGFRVFLPLAFDKKVCGFIVLGEKTDESPYYDADINYLEAARLAIGALLQYKRDMERLRLINEETQGDLARLTDFIGKGGEVKSREVHNKNIVYKSQAMHTVMENLEKMAGAEQPVLITGETGTGKELIARLLHEHSDRKDKPFIAVNCAAINDTLWEDELFGHVKGAFTDAKGERAGRVKEAGQGSLFLDEIGEMPLEMQAKLLRLLQERSFSQVGSDKSLSAECRFIFATNRNLQETIAAGSFREDLYYRINVFELALPALKERRDDIAVLLRHFIEKSSGALDRPLKNVAPDALSILMRYDWPGNIRELENFIVRASALAATDTLHIDDLPLSMRNRPRKSAPDLVLTHSVSGDNRPLRELVDDYTRRIIIETLARTNGNRTRAAELLGVKRGSLLYRIKELGIS